ncbi:hypothetical protein [Steroidobacter agaridevorans]|uniref:hypothetical protein n=1 Tax=Steroidobacter agaridevorans TaxID=2695856 RepID=UPI00137AB170|nr:hypothetical protein [Steroidobacter agaridevorans]
MLGAIQRDAGCELLVIAGADQKAGVRHDDARLGLVAAGEPLAFVAHDLAIFVDVDFLAEVIHIVRWTAGGEEVSRDLDQLAIGRFLFFDDARGDFSFAAAIADYDVARFS